MAGFVKYVAAIRIQHAWKRRVKIHQGDVVRYNQHTWSVTAASGTGELELLRRVARLRFHVSWVPRKDVTLHRRRRHADPNAAPRQLAELCP